MNRWQRKSKFLTSVIASLPTVVRPGISKPRSSCSTATTKISPSFLVFPTRRGTFKKFPAAERALKSVKKVIPSKSKMTSPISLTSKIMTDRLEWQRNQAHSLQHFSNRLLRQLSYNYIDRHRHLKQTF